MLSDVTAAQVRHFREVRAMSRTDLAARCAALGWPALTHGALGHIETGRRGPDGVRRREVTVDEIVILAAALGVPPISLIVPVGHAADVEILPGLTVPVGDALLWIGGDVDRLPGVGGQVDEATLALMSAVRDHGAVVLNLEAAAERFGGWTQLAELVTPAGIAEAHAAVAEAGAARRAAKDDLAREIGEQATIEAHSRSRAARRVPHRPLDDSDRSARRLAAAEEELAAAQDREQDVRQAAKDVTIIRRLRREMRAAVDVLPALPAGLEWIDEEVSDASVVE